VKIDKLEKYFEVEKVIFHSLDIALYNVSAIVEGKEYTITDKKGKPLKSHNLVSLQKQLKNVKSKENVLRQVSAYDEMIGGPVKTSNEMEVPLGDNKLYWAARSVNVTEEAYVIELKDLWNSSLLSFISNPTPAFCWPTINEVCTFEYRARKQWNYELIISANTSSIACEYSFNSSQGN